MNEQKLKKELTKFIKDVMNQSTFEGCIWKKLDRRYALVFAWMIDEDGTNILRGKIAYNCDDLQCDYEWDWEMPLRKTDDSVIGTDLMNCEIYKECPEELADQFINDYNYILKEAKTND